MCAASTSPLDESCINTARRLLSQCKTPIPKISSIADIDSNFIVFLFENILNINIPDLLHCVNKTEEAHNIQAVIDTLSLDLLGISMSHITGDDIVAGNVVAISNLLEVLECLAMYLSSSVQSHKSTEHILKRKVCKKRKSRESFLKNSSSMTDTATNSSAETSIMDVDNNKKVLIRKTKRRSLPRSQYEKTAKENKPHFHIETAISKNNENIKVEDRSPQKKLKRKIAKIRHVRSNEHPVQKDHEVGDWYEHNLEKKIRLLLEKNGSLKPRVANMKKVHLKTITNPIKKAPVSACQKSFLLPYPLRHRSVSRTPLRRTSPRKAQFSRNSLKAKDKRLSMKLKPGFIQELFQEFPGLQLTPQIMNNITKKYKKHLLKIQKQAESYLMKKPKTQMQDEEATRKQKALSNILKKDILHQQHLKELKESKKIENSIKFNLRDARLQSAKIKQYCDEFNTEMRKKTKKRNFTEELIFEKVFRDALQVQRDQVDRLCKEVDESGENDARKHLIYLENLENLYQSQFSLLSDMLTSEKRDAENKIKAEKQVINSFQREFREELKNEIRFMQRAIIECLGDTNFREQDAEKYATELRQRSS